MFIVLYGATRMAVFLADKLSKAGHNIIMCDSNPSILERVARNIDIGIRVIPERSWRILEDLRQDKPDMLMSLTKDDELNICLSTLAKNLGYPYTIAMLDRYASGKTSTIDIGRIFSIDHFIAPNMLAAYDIFERIVNPGAVTIETFAHGNIQMRTVEVPPTWPHSKTALKDLALPPKVRCALLFRPSKSGGEIIFPNGRERILPGDEVTVIGDGRVVLEEIPMFFEMKKKAAQAVIIIGASDVGTQLAKLLRGAGVWVKLIENDEKKCRDLATNLDGIDIIEGNGCDFNFLVSEKVSEASALVVATASDEFNMMAGALAKRAGAKNVIAIFEDQSLRPIVDELDLINEVSPWQSALKKVSSIIDKHTDMSQIGLYAGRAVMLEFRITESSKISGVCLDELQTMLPTDFLIVAIESRGYLEIARGSSVLCPHDTVIAIASPESRKVVEELC